MNTFLLDHLVGCTPLKPCASCVAANFLRSKLSEEDFNVLVGKIKATSPKYTPEKEALLKSSVDTLELTVRTSNILRSLEIYTIGNLVKNTDDDLIKMPNMGRKSLNEIKEVLALKQLQLGEVV